MTENVLADPENKVIQFTHSKQQRENRWKQVNIISRTCGRKTKDVTFIEQIFCKEKRKKMILKQYSEIMAKMFPMLGFVALVAH